MDDLIAQDADLIDVGPVAYRYGFDGYGWQYIDSGSGSDWAIRHPDGEPLYSHPPADLIETQAREIERLRERVKQLSEGWDAMGVKGQAIIDRLRAENDQLRETLAETLAGALGQIVSGTYPRPLGKPWRMDASSSKHDRCIHDAWMYETCEGCLDAFVAEALREYKEARDAKFGTPNVAD